MVAEKHESTSLKTPGQLLLAAREARSLSQEDIAKHTRLSVQVVNDLEQDSYSHIGVKTFVRGYLCSYARLVGISEAQILEAVDSSGLMPSATQTTFPSLEGAPVLNVTHQQTRSSYSRWFLFIIALFFFIVVMIWWQDQKDSTVKTIPPKQKSASFYSPPPQPVVKPKPANVTVPVVNTATQTLGSMTQPPAAIAPTTQPIPVNKNNIAQNIKTVGLHPTYTVSPAN